MFALTVLTIRPSAPAPARSMATYSRLIKRPATPRVPAILPTDIKQSNARLPAKTESKVSPIPPVSLVPSPPSSWTLNLQLVFHDLDFAYHRHPRYRPVTSKTEIHHHHHHYEVYESEVELTEYNDDD